MIKSPLTCDFGLRRRFGLRSAHFIRLPGRRAAWPLTVGSGHFVHGRVSGLRRGGAEGHPLVPPWQRRLRPEVEVPPVTIPFFEVLLDSGQELRSLLGHPRIVCRREQPPADVPGGQRLLPPHDHLGQEEHLHRAHHHTQRH